MIEIPLADPAAARIVDRPRLFAAQGQIAGLWRGGDHGEGTQDTEITDQCHDITVSPATKIAAAEGALYPGDVFNPQTQTQVSWPTALAAATASRAAK